jgi:Mn-dependent DtxR family transcriptional regulator
VDYKHLEKIVKGFSNHRRIQTLEYLETRPASLSEISAALKVNLKTIAEHTRRLDSAGLIAKKYKGREVVHKISQLGNDILTFLRKLE